MINLTTALVAISTLFVVFLLLRSRLLLKVCALCAAVSVTWFTLSLMLYSGVVVDPILIGVLLGGSIVGIMYLLEEKLPNEYSLFKLPFFLTLTAFAYSFLVREVSIEAMAVLIVTWVLFIILFIFKEKKGVRNYVERVIECCKNW